MTLLELEIKLSGILNFMVAPHRKPDTSEMVSSWFWERMQLLKEIKLPTRKFRVEQPRNWPARRALGQPCRRGRIFSAGVKSEPPWRAVLCSGSLRHWSQVLLPIGLLDLCTVPKCGSCRLLTIPYKGSSGISAGVAPIGAGPIRQGSVCVPAASRCGLMSVTECAGIRLASFVLLLLGVSAVGGTSLSAACLSLGSGEGYGGLVSVAVSSIGLLCWWSDCDHDRV